jgi:AraC-like DNA-binding protein
MPTFSAAQILAAVLTAIALTLVFQHRGNPHIRPFVLLTLAAALQAVLVSLRWDFQIAAVRPAQIVLTSLLPAASWFCFRSLTSPGHTHDVLRYWPHALPALAVLISLFTFPDVIDLIIIVTFIWYGIACLRLFLRGEAAFDRAALSSIPNLRRALGFIVFSLFGSAVIDVLVLLDFLRTQGANAGLMIGIGHVFLLSALIATVVFGSSAIADVDREQDEPVTFETPVTESDKEIASRVRALLTEGKLARDPDLTLRRIASRLTLPARSVSQAINRVEGCNVSQFVNTLRIDEACRLLGETDMPVTSIMFESGFQTKSNFNREFLRVTGKTPREWRDSQNNSLLTIVQ